MKSDRLEEIKVRFIGYAANHYKVNRSQVIDAGSTHDPRALWLQLHVVCDHGNSFNLMPVEAGDRPVALPVKLVTLADDFETTDNKYRTRTPIFAGQCQECGRVLFMVGPERYD